MSIIAIDIGSEVSSVCVRGKNGEIRQEMAVATQISKFKAIIKGTVRPWNVVFEEGTQAAWLWSELEPICDDVFVCDPRRASKLGSQFKNDKNDARNLSQLALSNSLKRVWHGGKELQVLKEAVRAYQNLTEQSTRTKNQIKAVFRGRGIKIGVSAYDPTSRSAAIKRLPLAIQRERVNHLGQLLDMITAKRAEALKTMIQEGRQNKMYKALRNIDGLGPIFSACVIAEIGDPHRFRTRQQLWSYAGLAVATYESSEFELRGDRAVRKVRAVKTRGLVRAYNRTLKGVFKQAAKTLSRTKWKTQYMELLARSKNGNNALLTLARKHAAVVLSIAKTGEKYDLAKVFKAH